MRILFALVLLSAIPFGVSGQTADWVKYAPAGQGFSILLPQNPKLADDPRPNGNIIHRASAQDLDGTGVFYASYWDFPSTQTYNLDKLRDPNENVVSETKISIGGYPGRELRVLIAGKKRDLYKILRAYVVGQRVYMLQYITPQDLDATVVNRKAAKFFDSFTVGVRN